MCHVIVTTPLSGMTTSAGWDLLPLYLQTKFEVSNYTHYEDIRSGAKCTNWGSLGRLGVIQVIGNVTIR